MDNIKTYLLGGSKQSDENQKLLDIIANLQKENANLKSTVSDLQEKAIERKQSKQFTIDEYAVKNLKIFLSNKEEKALQNPDIFKYDEGYTAFDKNINKFYKYQKEFIQDWAVSSQELVILYYGVGTGKSLIAVNCAEQFMDINPDKYVYFLLPASLVLDMINKMFQAGIDATRKHSKNGDYIYNFISYQQCLRSQLDFKQDSLLIVDEAHNLRNFSTKNISEKVSGRNWVTTGSYSLVGTKLAIALLTNENKFMRTIFMTGTLLINKPEDIEPIIALGYKKAPLTNYMLDEFQLILNDKERFYNYFNGLMSFYRKPTDSPNFPTAKYHFIPLEGKPEKVGEVGAHDDFRYLTRNAFNETKAKWVIDFIKKHKNEKTLVYSQYIDLSVNLLTDKLDDLEIPYVKISGEANAKNKALLVEKYNTNEVKICIYTLAIKEGISFKETNNFICVQPYWNYAIMEQIIARGIRSDSHKLGIKSTVNNYMLVGTDRYGFSGVEKFCGEAQAIMNNDIKKYRDTFKITVSETRGKKIMVRDSGKLEKYARLANNSRDVMLYITMFVKQAVINDFEDDLINVVPSFEKTNNIENNEFITSYNQTIMEQEEKRGKMLNLKEKMALKKAMYSEFYKKQIEKVNNTVIRFDKDINYKTLRNPDIAEIASKNEKTDIVSKVKILLQKGESLNKILESFKLSKQEITTFQANFTPDSEVEKMVQQSGIKNDKREKLLILEPTAGIGNVISGLLNLPNKQNFMIDSVEIHNVFYQISQARFDMINNIKLYNVDFLKFQTRYQYDYILGNPPFNLRTQIQIWNKKTRKIDDEDKTLFDVDFVEMCYNKLKDGGNLTMIISNRFQRDTKIYVFEAFRNHIEAFAKMNPDNVKITPIEQFKETKTTTKEMTTNFGMVCITLIKIENVIMDLTKKFKYEKEEDEEDVTKTKKIKKLPKTKKEPEPEPEPEPETKKKIIKLKGKGKNIVMPKAELIKEHKILIPILKSGSKKAQIAEALKQETEMQNLKGKGIGSFLKKGFKKGIKIANKITKILPSSDDNAREGWDDEKHAVLLLPNGKYGRANFEGPGTHIIARLKRNDPPRTAMDELSMYHDIRYSLATSQKDIEIADEIFIAGAKKILAQKKDNAVNVNLGLKAIQAKYHAEKKGIIKPIADIEEHNPEDKAFLESKLSMHPVGFGKKIKKFKNTK